LALEDIHRLEKELEGAINELQGIISSHIAFNGSQNIEEIHVLANFDRSPKQIVRDIESALVTRFGIRIDHKKVSVAQVKGEESHPALSSRIKFSGLDLSVSGLQTEVQVELVRDSVVSSGVASGPNSRKNQLRLISQATLKAVERFLKPNYSLVLEDVVSIPLASHEVILASITSLSTREEMKLIGCAFVKGDLGRAVIFATLDALNRAIGSLLEEEA